jgi:hypothetical protein
MGQINKQTQNLTTTQCHNNIETLHSRPPINKFPTTNKQQQQQQQQIDITMHQVGNGSSGQ